MTEKEEFQSFWDLLVPPNGKAETVQGEVIRIAGRIEYEFLDNGCINWDEDFKKMLDAFLRYVQLGNGFSGDDLSSAELLVHLLKDNGDKGFIDDNLTTVLCSCAVAWVKCIFRKNRALAPHERSAVPLGTDHCPVC